MKLMDLVKPDTFHVVSKQIGGFIFKNSPQILTGLGLAGLVATAITAIKDRDRANRMMEKEKDRLYNEWVEEANVDPYVEPKFTNIEIAKKTWKCYIPTVATMFASGACILGANSINQRRIAALTGLYSLADTALREYQAKVIETVGEKKETKLREDIAQDKLDKHPIDQATAAILNTPDKVLCFEPLSGRYFEDTYEHIIHVQNEFNRGLIIESYLTLNELYDKLDLEHTELGNNLGWTANVGLVDFTFTSKLAKNNRPCLVLDFRIGPHSL